VVSILADTVSVEELRIPSRNFNRMGLRILDMGRKIWADYWCNGSNGVLNPATWGGFSNGAGIWDAYESNEGMDLVVRGVWDQITPSTCRWRQMVSENDGVSWEENWIMHWTRVDATAGISA
jgi:hypothetical protein